MLISLVTPSRRLPLLALAAVLLQVPQPRATDAQDICPGDCDGDGVVTVAELVTLVNIALGNASIDACPSADVNGDATVSIAELIAAVPSALSGCPTAPPLCAAFTVAPRNGARVLAGPGLVVQPGGAFVLASGSTGVTAGSQPRATGEIFLHRYAASGAFLGQDRLAVRERVILAPALARLPNSGGVATWGEANPRDFESPITRLAVRRFGSNGSPLGNVALAASVTAGHALSGPSVATDAGGNALLAWTDVQQVSPGGIVISTMLRQQRPSGLLPAQPLSCFGDPSAIAPGTQLGAVCIAFELAPAQIALRAFALEQGIPMAQFDVDAATPPFSSIAAAASSDRLVAVWRQPLDTVSNRSRVLAQVVDLAGAPLTAVIEVGTVLETTVPPSGAVLPDGSFAVAFGESPLLLRRFAAEGTGQGEALVIADTRVEALALAGDDAGNLVVAWRWLDVLARQVRAPGSTCP